MRTFKIGSFIKPVVYKKKYKLLVSNMSGDADAFETSEAYFSKAEQPMLSDILDFLDWASDREIWPGRKEIRQEWERLQEKWEELPEDLLTNDVTTDGEHKCRPSLESLTWFDAEGLEYEVKAESENTK